MTTRQKFVNEVLACVESEATESYRRNKKAVEDYKLYVEDQLFRLEYELNRQIVMLEEAENDMLDGFGMCDKCNHVYFLDDDHGVEFTSECDGHKEALVAPRPVNYASLGYL